MTSAPPVQPAPPAAGELFGERFPLAVRYAELLVTWGVERGLIGPREPARIWDRHLLNCAALAGAVPPGAAVVDIGSGAGLPGIPVALARPEAKVVLSEPMRRRVDFLHDAVAALELDVEVLGARAEELPRSAADFVVVRAVAPLARLLPMALPLLRRGGTLLALKGRTATAEVEEARRTLRRWPGARVTVGTVGLAGVSAAVVRVELSESDKGVNP